MLLELDMRKCTLAKLIMTEHKKEKEVTYNVTS